MKVAPALATMQDCRTIIDQNGAEELTPPGQAIPVRGTETLTVMTPTGPTTRAGLMAERRALCDCGLETARVKWQMRQLDVVRPHLSGI